jgi:hypothetical protein
MMGMSVPGLVTNRKRNDNEYMAYVTFILGYVERSGCPAVGSPLLRTTGVYFITMRRTKAKTSTAIMSDLLCHAEFARLQKTDPRTPLGGSGSLRPSIGKS